MGTLTVTPSPWTTCALWLDQTLFLVLQSPELRRSRAHRVDIPVATGPHAVQVESISDRLIIEILNIDQNALKHQEKLIERYLARHSEAEPKIRGYLNDRGIAAAENLSRTQYFDITTDEDTLLANLRPEHRSPLTEKYLLRPQKRGTIHTM
jgi:hypothetical protein